MAKVKGKGTLLKRATVTMAQRVTLSGPQIEMGEVDCTDLDSTVKETASTILKLGALSGTAFYDPADATHKQMLSDIQAGTVSLWELTFADASVMSFDAFVKTFEPTGMEVEGLLQFNFSIMPTGTNVTLPDA